MKKIICLILILITCCAEAVGAAAQQNPFAIEKNSSIVVMDLGVRPGAVPEVIDINGAGGTSCEYLITRLVTNDFFCVMDKDSVIPLLKKQGLRTEGLIDPDSAIRIGKLLNAKYLLYGNLTGVTVSDVSSTMLFNGVTKCTVKAHVIARVMDIDTGRIIYAIKGNGKSQSAFTKIAVGPLYSPQIIKIGNVGITQDSVHNAVKNASYDAVDNLFVKLGLLKGKSKK